MAPTTTHSGWQDRYRSGQALRKQVPRSSHGTWREPPDRPDPVEVLEEQGRSRVSELLAVRYWRMARSPFGFFRGAAAVMAIDLDSTPATGLRVQACGDAHINNFGEFATPERNMVFDINDFDETTAGPWEWDMKRLCASLGVVARQRGLAEDVARRLIRACALEYRQRMLAYADMPALDLWYDRIHVDDVIAHFPKAYRTRVQRHTDRAKRKTHLRAAAKLSRNDIDGAHFVEDPPLLVRLERTEYEMDEVVTMIDNYRLTLNNDRRTLFDRFELADVARKVVGVGSVGTHCWVLLFDGPDRPGGDPLVLQIKEAQQSVLEPYVGTSPFDHHGRRVVEGQRLTQAASDIFLGWTQGPRSGRHYYVRQLWDIKGQGDPMAMDREGATYYAALCAWALARAHARTGDAVRIAGYLGHSGVFDEAMCSFGLRYAETNERDHGALVAAISRGRLATMAR